MTGKTHPSKTTRARAPLAGSALLPAGEMNESVWVEVIRKMEQTYAELLDSQVSLEDSNQELEEANNFISGILNSMNDLLIVCNPHGEISQTNPALHRMTGQGPDQLRGQPVEALFYPDSQGNLEHLLERARLGKLLDYELQLRGRFGRVPVSINCTLQFDRRNRLQSLVIIGRSVSELRRAYDELNKSLAELKVMQENLVNSEKMASLGRLVAGVAHELNNPISFVYGNTHVLMKYMDRVRQYIEAVEKQGAGAADSELNSLSRDLRIDRIMADLPALLQGSMEGIERVRDIVGDLRQFSSGQQSERSRFDLLHVLETAVRWVTRDRELTIEYQLPETLTATGHPGRIHQVLMNLLQNAVDVTAGQPHPQVRISAWQQSGWTSLTVQDNGPGIPEAYLDKIFEPFYTTKPVGQGTGLGLSLSYSFATEHGGNLKAANLPERGAIFTLELPE